MTVPTSGRTARVVVPALAALLLAAALAGPTAAARAPKAAATATAPTAQTHEHVLANGMKLVVVPRHLSPTIAAGWVAKVGSVNERPGITGISHLFEHMMFKGTKVIGTRDADKDLALIAEQERVREAMRAEESQLRAAQRRGEIDDMTRPEHKTERYRALEAQFDSLVKAQRDNMVKNEFNTVLQKNGASFINAFTNEDQTFYFEVVPANKLELWFWMETDRLQNPVFREFYSERDVVYEERRLRYESTPTGVQKQSFDAMFWDASPYAWPVIGWPSDVANITLEQANEYYDLYYAPHNLTAILVGDVNFEQAVALAERYFGTLPKATRPTPEMITAETKQTAEKRFDAEAETNPAVDVRWHTPAFVHRDVPALFVLAELLDGTTGRLERALVLDQKVATATDVTHDPRKYEGLFEIHAECKEGTTPEALEKAMHAEIEKLRQAPPTAEELQSAKNRYLAGGYRQLTSSFPLLFRYAIGEGRGTWRDVDRIEQQVQHVTGADIQRVATRYFTKENRAVALWRRKGGTTQDPALAALPAQAQGMVRQMLAQVAASTDASKLEQMLSQMDAMGAQVPPDMKPAVDYVKTQVQKRIDQIKSGATSADGK
jgi:predicted Zn-dependent peptidase